MPLPAHRLLVLTDAAAVPGDLFSQVRKALDGGAFSLVLREKHLEPSSRRRLADRLGEMLSAAGGELIVSDPTWPVTGCHLSATALVPVPRPLLVGRSHHAGEPISSDVDYISHSPIHLTVSKPGYGPAVGYRGLRELCSASPVPVFALGGIDSADHAATCVSAGAHGVAMMGAIMRAEDPADLVAAVGSVLA